MPNGKSPLSQRDLSSDDELYSFSRLDHNPDTSTVDLLLRSTKDRQKGTN